MEPVMYIEYVEKEPWASFTDFIKINNNTVQLGEQINNS